ncbi:MAG: hypothetical protein ACI9FJ_001918 [Alteromonadaceae bacterium]|jgi:hypothetical protein
MVVIGTDDSISVRLIREPVTAIFSTAFYLSAANAVLGAIIAVDAAPNTTAKRIDFASFE